MKAFLCAVLGLAAALGLNLAQAQPAPSGEDLVKRLGCHALAGQGGSRGPHWDGRTTV